ncbi:hypothetical protein BD560DRAFT_441580 [Blakeslea trispora]|nr:hypothetical protein BD560DRAFT_441580 [Blakeslea trispora]
MKWVRITWEMVTQNASNCWKHVGIHPVAATGQDISTFEPVNEGGNDVLVERSLTTTFNHFYCDSFYENEGFFEDQEAKTADEVEEEEEEEEEEVVSVSTKRKHQMDHLQKLLETYEASDDEELSMMITMSNVFKKLKRREQESILVHANLLATLAYGRRRLRS